ncbi:MAG TPA: HAD-IA family hydrolase [Novosphingobium sp.]|nr:HAD-IA family hydrolase [Novosphingobium sp.]
MASSRLAVFDCDGTLVDGQADIIAAMDEAFARLDLPARPAQAVRRIVGLSLPAAMARLAPEADAQLVADLVEAYKAAFRRARQEGRLAEPLFPGIRALVDELRAEGWQLAIATGKSDRGLAHCLAAHGLESHFDSLQTADRHPSKPHPAMLEAALAECLAQPHQAVMIGDTAFDIAMAEAAGVRAIGVAWGYHPPAELLAAGAVGVANSVRELGEMLRAG